MDSIIIRRNRDLAGPPKSVMVTLTKKATLPYYERAAPCVLDLTLQSNLSSTQQMRTGFDWLEGLKLKGSKKIFL